MSCNGARFEPLYELRPANRALVDRHQGDRYKKKFLYWDHLHTRQVRRTTLADANERRDPILFEELTRALMAQAGKAIRTERRELLYLIDSTTIGLHGRANEWTQASATRTGGLKVHGQLEGASLAPVHHTITPANVNDSSEGRKIEPQREATYVFDQGYCDYGWGHRFTEAGARFVTRLKNTGA